LEEGSLRETCVNLFIFWKGGSILIINCMYRNLFGIIYIGWMRELFFRHLEKGLAADCFSDIKKILWSGVIRSSVYMVLNKGIDFSK